MPFSGIADLMTSGNPADVFRGHGIYRSVLLGNFRFHTSICLEGGKRMRHREKTNPGVLCNVLYYFPWSGCTISFKYLEFYLPLCLHFCCCIHTHMSKAHRGSSQTRVSKPGSAIYLNVRTFILKSCSNGYTTQICLVNNSHRQSTKNKGSK